MREEIARLDNERSQIDRERLQFQTAYNATCELTKSLREKLEEAREQIECAKEIIGPHFVALNPEIMSVWHNGQYPVRLPMFQSHDVEIGDFNINSAVNRSVIRDLPLHVLLSSVDIDPIKEYLHIRVELANKRVAYAVSQRVIKDMPLKALTQTISEEMARQIVGELRNVGAR